MRLLDGLVATVGFASPVTVGDAVYSGDMTWEVGDGFGGWLPIDPTTGFQNAVVSIAIPPGGQSVQLTKVADGDPFSLRATFPAAAGACSVSQRSMDFQWSAPVVYVAPLCVS